MKSRLHCRDHHIELASWSAVRWLPWLVGGGWFWPWRWQWQWHTVLFLLVTLNGGAASFQYPQTQPTAFTFSSSSYFRLTFPRRHGDIVTVGSVSRRGQLCLSTRKTRLLFSLPGSSFLRDFASALFATVGKAMLPARPAVDEALLNLVQLTPATSGINRHVADWSNIRSLLEMQMTEDERQFRPGVLNGTMASPLNSIRLFGSDTPNQVRVVFYRDSASWCPYCQKTWIALEEKQISYRVEKINMRCYGDKPLFFTRMQPSGQIPVAEIDGVVYGQSNDILYALEERFPDKAKLLPDPGQRQEQNRAQELLRLERQIFGVWMYWLTGRDDSTGSLRKRFVSSLQEVEKALAQSNGPFFMGKSMSLVDCMFAPFLERMAASLLYYKGFMMRVTPDQYQQSPYPNLNRWFDAMEEKPSYQLSKSDYYTHCWDLPPQLGGCVTEPAGEQYRRVIDGAGWELPLPPSNDGIEPDWVWAGGTDPARAKREAIERVTFNHAAIVKFALRGAGMPGLPPVSAPLSDPNAVSNMNLAATVEKFLQTVCLAMLSSTESYDSTCTEMARIVVQQGGVDYAMGIVNSLVYVRDRIGVPRDMRLPAALQLRAHLNWAITAVRQEQQQ